MIPAERKKKKKGEKAAGTFRDSSVETPIRLSIRRVSYEITKNVSY